MTRAPLSISSPIVGTLARMRPSSPMTPSSMGTFRSERTSTRLPVNVAKIVDRSHACSLKVANPPA